MKTFLTNESHLNYCLIIAHFDVVCTSLAALESYCVSEGFIYSF